jgi:hypothetical protein
MFSTDWRGITRCSAIAADMLLASIGPGSAQQRQPGPPPQQQQPQQQAPQGQGERVQVVELNQAMLDRWLVLFAELSQRLAAAPNATEQQTDAIVAEACKRAQLANVDQCRALDAYMGALLSGANDEQRRFDDPIARVREDLKQSQADPKLTPQDKAEARKELEAVLAQLPAQIPAAHLQLVNRNAAKIFELLAKYQPADQQGGPPPAQGAQPPAQQPPAQQQPRR